MTTTQELMDLAIQRDNPPRLNFRDHSGFSNLGSPCLRQIWNDNHWVSEKQFAAKILRKFDRGHGDEERLKRYLRSAGFTVCDVEELTGKQFSFKVEGCGFLAGSVDGVVKGLPELDEDQWALWECKSMGNATFNTLQKQGLKQANVKYWVQCHLYMFHAELEVCCFMALNCDSQEIYTEFFEVDRDLARLEISKGKRLLELWHEEVPKIAENEGYFVCRNLCSHRDVCHRDAPPARNCRTCRHLTPDFKGDPTWLCSKHGVNLDRKGLLAACEEYQVMKVLETR